MTASVRKSLALVMSLVLTLTAFCSLTVFPASAAAASQPGDINGDGTINIVDSLRLFAHCSGKLTLTDAEKATADYNLDGNINTTDAAQVFAFVGGKRLPHPPVSMPSEYELRVFELVNERRAEEGVPPLKYAYELQHFGDVRAAEIQDYWSHTRPNGEICFSLFDEYDSYGHVAGGENIAEGHVTPEEVVAAWMNSPGHRKNILNPDFTLLAVGCQKSDYGMGNGYSWTQMFCYW